MRMKTILVGAFLAASLATAAVADYFTTGLPQVTSPTGSERLPVDTETAGGAPPQSAYVLMSQLGGGTAVSGVANGYKVARGETALDGSNPTPVTTGLATIVACNVAIKTTSAPALSTSVVTYGSSTGTLNMYGWKPTGAGDTTLIASTGTDTIGWICVGT